MKNIENNCTVYHEAILNYVWLDVEERKKLEEHIDECPKCKKQYESIQLMDLELTSFFGNTNENREDFPDFTANIMASLKEEKSSLFDFNSLLTYLTLAITAEVILLIFFRTDTISKSSFWGDSYEIVSTGLANSFSDVTELLSYGWHSTVIYGNYFSLGLDWILIFAVLFCVPLLISQLLMQNRKGRTYEHRSI